MNQKDAFEKWYCEKYWNFHETWPNIWNESTKDYEHLDVSLAWNAWRDGIRSIGLGCDTCPGMPSLTDERISDLAFKAVMGIDINHI